MTETDPIDAYLDDVCKLLPFTQSDEKMAERWKLTYGIEVSSDVMSSALPEEFQILIAESRSEGETLRTELRSHIDAAVARFEVDGVNHDTAVRQAIKEFGNAKRLNRLLRKEFKGTVKARVDRALRGMKQAQSKRDNAIGWLKSFLTIWPIIWPVQVGMMQGSATNTVIRWTTWSILGGAFSGWYETRVTRTDRNVLAGLQSIFNQADVPNKTVKQKLTSAFMKSMINRSAEGNSLRPADIALSFFKRITLLAVLWFVPLSTEVRLYLFYLCAAMLGKWFGELIATATRRRVEDSTQP